MEENEIEVRNLTKLYTLVLIKSHNDVTGYYILKMLEKDLKKTASPTYVYKFLKELEEQGYIKKNQNSKSKKNKGYSLTSSGNDFIARIFNRFNNLIEVAVQSKLKICTSCGVKLYEGYYSEKIGDKEMNFCCTHCAAAYKKDHKHE